MDNDELCRYIKLYHGAVYRAVFGYLHNASEAEDIVQETFVKLFHTSRRFESDEHCKAWLIRAAINLSKNLLKSFRYTHTEELDEAIPIESKEDSALADALSALPPKYRAVIHLHYYEGYSAKEIAKILGLTVTAVTTRLARARERLKALMTSEDFFQNNRSNARMRRDTHERRIQ